MIPTDDSCDTNPMIQHSTLPNYWNYDLCFYHYVESQCDKPLLAHDVYMRWIHQMNANFAHLTEKQIQLAAYTGYSLMYRTAADNEIRTVVQ